MLDNVACARIAHTTRSLRAVSEALVAERLQRALHESYVLRDAVAPHRKPLLALSHLESLAKSELLFETSRDLLKLFYEVDSDDAEHSGVLLELDRCDDAKLCDAISMIAFPSSAACEQHKLLLRPLLAKAISQFRLPKDRWWVGLLKSLGRRCHSTQRERGMGTSLKMFMNGVGDILPVTNVALRATKSLESQATAASLLCQCLERLMYPASAEALVLHIALPVDAGALVPTNVESDPVVMPAEKRETPGTSTHEPNSDQQAELPVTATNEAPKDETATASSTEVERSKSAACWAAAAATGAAIAQADQPQEFLHTLRSLE
eukprot:CAMPEP_0169267924 /NCGR_PEP_ID=MMETSP1016-20121227/47457_1 /TAXON_ID=342587 /ORGANISM="Karlodinium micrum, Strain CCMP2283" /LENGTH=321 /DNA_ID=CAMNT_0009352463 /DNA_START=48 /DNA_END=1010 /DNA_ORIENTATION=-